MEGVERGKLTPVHSAKSVVKRAAGILIAIAVSMFGIAYWVTPLAIVAWPLVMILAIAVVFTTPLLKSGSPVLTIDESGVHDARIMKRPVPWSEISRINERAIRNPVTGSVIDTAFVLEIEHWEEWIKWPAGSLLIVLTSIFSWQIYFICFAREGIPILATGLDYSTEGLRDTFEQARAVGLLNP